jgi:hypothetical protein
MRILLAAGAAALLFQVSSRPLRAQAIEFESNGLHYQTMTRDGLTIMFASLPTQVRDYALVQVAVSNGSPSSRTVKPEDFSFIRKDGRVLPATPARNVVQRFLDKAGRNDVIRLVGTYEMGLYGLSRFQSTNGYEVRRQAALAEVSSSRLKAAAAASAIVLVPTRLQPGDSTDGAIFFAVEGKDLGEGKLIATVGSERFEFQVGGYKHPGELMRRP